MTDRSIDLCKRIMAYILLFLICLFLAAITPENNAIPDKLSMKKQAIINAWIKQQGEKNGGTLIPDLHFPLNVATNR